MTGDVSIDVGSAVPYLVDCIKSWFGKDKFTVTAKERFERIFRISLETASHIQIVGMWKPIPIIDIYQRTRLKNSPYEWSNEANRETTIWELIRNKKNAVIFAGPGDGKTTLMNWTFIKLLNNSKSTPLLFTLRWPNSIHNLESFIKDLREGRNPTKNKKSSLILLVDGYDEINPKDREVVSQLLTEFASFGIGNFYLTCRTHYHIYNLIAQHYWIADFNQDDALGFCKSFLNAYGADFDPSNLLKELDRRNLKSFTEHPLMLALVCLLQASAIQGLPRSSLGLIRRAIDTLTFRWDESKGLTRLSRIPLDGEERVRCLMRIAYSFIHLVGSYDMAEKAVQEHLERQQIRGIDTRKFLIELAQWYGIFVPTSMDQWTFVHRTIHDFLAARFWVESGEFSIKRAKKDWRGRIWNSRAAFAMSIVPDATAFLQVALQDHCEMYVLSQCLLNNAIFEPHEIANYVINYFRDEDVNKFYRLRKEKELEVYIASELDFFGDASIDFLEALILRGIRGYNDPIADIVLACSLLELLNRNCIIEESLYNKIYEYLFYSGFKFTIKKGNSHISFSLNQLLR